MTRALRGLLVLAVTSVLASSSPSASQRPGTLPRLVVSIEAPGCVELGEPLSLMLQVSDPVGIDRVVVLFAGQEHSIAVGGRTFAFLTPELSFDDARVRAGLLAGIDVTAVGIDGVRGGTAEAVVSIGGCGDRTATLGTDQLREMIENWKHRNLTPAAAYPRGKHYKPENVQARYWEPPAGQRVPRSIMGGMRPIQESYLTDWWRRWRELGGGQPFDWETHCPGAPGFTMHGEVLRCWLGLHPEVASEIDFATVDPETGIAVSDAYETWPPDWKDDLDIRFYQQWHWLNTGLGFALIDPLDPPVNSIPTYADKGITGLNAQQAWALYIRSVAHSLALEIGGFVPWTVTAYNSAELHAVFSGHELFRAGRHVYTVDGVPRTFNGFLCADADFMLTPAPISKVFRFLVDEDIIRPTHYQSIARLLEWTGKNINHAYSHNGDLDGKTDMEGVYMHWRYYGQPPVSRMIDGTIREGEDVVRNWTRGCSGTVPFWASVLRGLNIPVYPVRASGGGWLHLNTFRHTMVLWPTIGMALSHGDDANYFQTATVEQTLPPPAHVPITKIFITMSTFWDWFVTEPREQNIGRQRRFELKIDTLPNDILDLYCDDLAADRPLDTSLVAQHFSEYYTAYQLFWDRFLWYRLAQKEAALDYCAGSQSGPGH